MNRFGFIKDKLPIVMVQLLVLLLFGFVMRLLHASTAAIWMTCGFAGVLLLAVLVWDTVRRVRYYARLYALLEQMQQKQYVSALLEAPVSADTAVLCDILQQACKAMNDEIAAYQTEREEYRDYIERWIHEIKVPISCIDLLCTNHPSDVTRSIAQENARTEAYIEQALYYARSTNVEKDYIIRAVCLDDVIKGSVKKHARELIAANTKLEFEGLEQTVYADAKWLDFVLGQILSNSVKYRRGDALTLSFRARKRDDQIMLTITDDGIGIAAGDLGRVTEKGFTGENGRKFAKSTGMGLYLCRQLCEKMSLGFAVQSEEGKGTMIKIAFPMLEMQ